jgi:hypothetical protein
MLPVWIAMLCVFSHDDPGRCSQWDDKLYLLNRLYRKGEEATNLEEENKEVKKFPRHRKWNDDEAEVIIKVGC